MKLLRTEIQGVVIVELDSFSDHRGAFSRLYCEQELAAIIGNRHIVQMNQSRTTTRGAIRGLHYQRPPYSEMKLVRCLKGRVWDVAVDLRAGSPTFLAWHAVELGPDNARMMIIPEGCAHGFQVLEVNSELLYLHTAIYNPAAEGGLLYNDPKLEIKWPMPAAELSERDKNHALLNSDFRGISL
jgi:dTDP-4-dehydrorhamnose 3,5-epimerase